MTGDPRPDDPSLSLLQRIDDLATRFEDAWKAGPRPSLPDFIPADWPAHERAALLLHLLDLDVAYRRRAGESPAPDDYAPRLPDLAPAIHDWFHRQPTCPFASLPDPAPAPPSLPPAFGRYQVLARLGGGTFGDVYKARDPDVARLVAVKVPRPGIVEALGGPDAFLREARVVGDLHYPHVVTVHDVGRTGDGSCYIVSAFIDGPDLATRLRAGRLPFADTARLVASVADALHHAHLRRLVHRDVKPANILLDKADTPYLADFGLALREDDFGQGAHWVGTLAYMSPEQARREGHRVTGSSDIFSLGVVLYEMLTGRRPFAAADPRDTDELRRQIIHHDPTPPRQRDDAIPAELERICLKALAKRVPERYTTARDLAADLRAWHSAQSPAPAPITPTPVPVTTAAATPTPPPAPSPLPAAGPAPVVFKGLRSFDARDADFFLQLVPGPRDRDGLPESLRFWKARLEETDPDATFPVGLLYGPSGCGKSSLVKAGLLPRLAAGVVPVYVEATPDDTETRLLRGLRKAVPALPESLGLPDSLAWLRRDAAAERKVVLVLDQFEQWLHARGRDGDAELVTALRQCDGLRTQALLLVRDDFWMAVTRLFQDLEIPLLEGHNSAAVDLFDPRHARKVLASFGRSLGDLPQGDLAPDERRFLDEAVAELAEDGRVIPVRLALFAQMVKGQPWAPGTVARLGGLGGIGATFLEQTFTAPGAPPAHRLHQAAARTVLAALLPDPGSPIKGHRRTREELLDRSGYAARPRDFADLLHILDAELRLITPTDPAADAATPPSTAAPAYQLTHDYLVPSLREWLTRKRRQSRKGRAELRLEDRAAEYARAPDARHLPAWWEWLDMRAFTRRRDWTATQARMMRRAARTHLLRGLALLAIVGLVAWGTFEGLSYLLASARVNQIVSAETTDVPRLVAELPGHRRWADPLLGQRLAAPDLPEKERLHVALALAPVDPAQTDFLTNRLLTATPAALPVLRDALRPYQDRAADRLWAIAEDDKADGPARLRAAAALAAYQPADPRWPALGPALANLLVTENVLGLGSWIESFAPVKDALLPALDAVYHDAARPEAERSLATAVLAEYAREQPTLLTNLLLDGDDRQFTTLLPRLRDLGEPAVALLRAEVRRTLPPPWPDKPLPPGTPEPPADAVRAVEAADGMVADRFAFCLALPLDRAPGVVEALARAGYRPTRLRPYAHGTETKAALVWTRDASEPAHLEIGLSLDDLTRKAAEMTAAGYEPMDVAGWRTTAAPPQDRYAALWHKAAVPGPTARLFAGRTREELTGEDWPAHREANLAPRTLHAFLAADGAPRFSGVVAPSTDEPRPWSVVNITPTEYQGRATADSRQNDAAPLIDSSASRYDLETALRFDRDRVEGAARTLADQPGDLDARLQRGDGLFWLGQDRQALEDLDPVLAASPDNVVARSTRTLVLARLGRTGPAKADLAAFERLDAAPVWKAWVRALAAAYLGEDEEGLRRLERDLADQQRDPGWVLSAAHAYAMAAQVVGPRAPARGRAYQDRAVALLRQLRESKQLDPGRPLRQMRELAALRDHPGFLDLLREQAGGDRRYTGVWAAPGPFESLSLHDLPPADALRRARDLARDGWRPASVAVAGDSAQAVLVWQRPRTDPAARIALARRQAAAALALDRLGRDDDDARALWQHSPTPDARSWLVARAAPAGLDPARLIERLDRETDVSSRRALVLALGEFPGRQLPPDLQTALRPRLLDWYRTDPDPGVHAALDWLLRHDKEGDRDRPLAWGGRKDLDRIDGDLAAAARARRDREAASRLAAVLVPDPLACAMALAARPGPAPPVSPAPAWHVNSLGMTFTVLTPPPDGFLMGSPPDEPSRIAANEGLHRRRIGRTFALASRPVSVALFRQFLAERPGVQHSYSKEYSPDPDGPIISVTWFEAAQFCNWLSEKEGIPRDQWCYPEDVRLGMQPLPDALKRTGYRLPTEAEWEYACRAGTATSRSFGDDEGLLPRYAWYNANGQNRAWPAGQKRPNDWGLFDIHGNVWTWCHNVALRYPLGEAAEDGEDKIPYSDNYSRLLRGGSFSNLPAGVRSAIRGNYRPSIRSNDVGLRPARTYH